MAQIDFRLTTDYPLDKVIKIIDGSSSVPFPTMGMIIEIPHGLPFAPLPDGNWSLTPDFSVTQEFGSGTFPSSNGGASVFDISAYIYSDATNIYIMPINVSGSGFTLYYRVIGFEPADLANDLDFTASSADDFVLNTDYNYCKLLVASQVISPPAPSTTVYNHGLGYLPQVRAWRRTLSGEIYLMTDTGVYGGTPGSYAVIVDNNNVSFYCDSSNISRFDYRIYIDESGVL